MDRPTYRRGSRGLTVWLSRRGAVLDRTYQTLPYTKRTDWKHGLSLTTINIRWENMVLNLILSGKHLWFYREIQNLIMSIWLKSYYYVPYEIFFVHVYLVYYKRKSSWKALKFSLRTGKINNFVCITKQLIVCCRVLFL